MNRLAFTLCSNNYLAQATVLGNSLMRWNPEIVFIIGLIDRKTKTISYEHIPFHILEVEKIEIPDFDGMLKRYNVIELNTAVKPFYFRYLMNSYKDVTSLIYFDPDICIYSELSEVFNPLKEFDIILTPHCTSPINDDKLPSENDFLNAGLYNLGFLALKKTENTEGMISWWADRLTKRAHIDYAQGMFTDQLWMNFAPLYFKKVCISDHAGFNVAYWNLHERKISIQKDKYSVNGEDLGFFHFSGFNPLEPDRLSKYQNRTELSSSIELRELFDDYINLLLTNNYEFYSTIPCYFKIEKEKIEAEERAKFLRDMPLSKRIIRSFVLRTTRLFNINLTQN